MVLIIIIILSGITLNSSYGSTIPQGIPVSDYNFSSLSPGTFPSNRSWITFESSMNSLSYARINKTSIGQGLQISTQPATTSKNSFLTMNMSVPSNFTLKITFSWNYRNNEALTWDNMIFEQNNSRLLNLAFGPLYHTSAYVNGTGSYDLGSTPAFSSFYTLQLSVPDSGKTGYFGITGGWNSTSGLPYSINLNGTFRNGSLQAVIGGGFSNATIYNIYLAHGTPGFGILGPGPSITYNVQKFNTHRNVTGNGTFGAYPVADWKLNSIMFMETGKMPGIYLFNYYNNTTLILANISNSADWAASYSDGNYAYFFVLFQDNSNLFRINTTSLSVVKYNFGPIKIDSPKLTVLGMNFFLINESGKVWIYNATGSVSRWANISSDFEQKVILSSVQNQQIILMAMNSSSREISNYSLDASGSLSENSNLYNAQMFDTSTVITASSNLSNCFSSEIHPGNNIPGGYLFGNSIYSPVAIQAASTAPLWSDPELSVISSGSTMEVVSGNITHDTNLPGTAAYAYFEGNLSFGFLANGSYLSIFFAGKFPFSGYSINGSLNGPSVLTGNVSFNYSISSGLNCTESSQIGNLTIAPLNGYLNFSSTEIGNGTCLLYLNATNDAGYTLSLVKKVHVDNYKPAIKIDPGNMSYISQDQLFSISISNISGQLYSSVSSGFFNYSFTGNAFNFTGTSNTSVMNLTLDLKDQFGILRAYRFEYNVVHSEITNFSANINNNSYLPFNKFNFSWKQVAYHSYYCLTVVSSGHRLAYNTSQNFSLLELPDGSYRIFLNATLLDGNFTSVGNEYVTVENYSPEISVNRTTGYFYSFSGNSNLDRMQINVTSNVTSSLFLNITSPGGEKETFSSAGNFGSFVIDPADFNLQGNGIYIMNVTAVDLSGERTSEIFYIDLNNTIPVNPLLNGTSYTNSSYFPLSIRLLPNVTYNYTISGNGTRFSGMLRKSGENISVPGFNNTLRLTATSAWGNSNTSVVTVYYSNSKPEIMVSAENSTLIWTHYAIVDYSIVDQVPLSGIQVSLDNKTLDAGTLYSSGSFILNLTRDGTFNVTVAAVDRSGNRNVSSTVRFSNYYFSDISGIAPRLDMFMGVSFFSSGISGINLKPINLTWLVDGHTASRSASFFTFIMPGYHNITLIVQYHSTEIVKSYHIFVPGFIPELLILVFVSILIYRRRVTSIKDMEMARELILKNAGAEKHTIISEARRERIDSKVIRKAMSRLNDQGIIKFKSDPDGRTYIMMATQKK
ncbi:MAG: hypothetical protein M1476_04340 [Candidatus Thermoplasmatota archaeon]|nr:hypothetical protein [Candidatus Thermoplasmatota archaeon]